MKGPVLSILVPVYNEEKTLNTILSKVASLSIDSYEVIIVNDASSDGSLGIIDDFVRNFKGSPKVSLNVISHARNKGKGAGIKTGLQNAKGRYFVIQDADLEYNPRDIPKLLNLAMKSGLSVVYGSRFRGDIEGMASSNYNANRFYNFLLRRLYRTNITDMHTCYKMVETNLLKDLNIISDGFDYAPEVISKLLRRGIEIHEVPISFRGRTKQEGKKINYRDGIECAYKIFKYRITRNI